MVRSFKNHLLKFKKNAGLDYFNTAGLDKFVEYLRSEAELEQIGTNPGTNPVATAESDDDGGVQRGGRGCGQNRGKESFAKTE